MVISGTQPCSSACEGPSINITVKDDIKGEGLKLLIPDTKAQYQTKKNYFKFHAKLPRRVQKAKKCKQAQVSGLILHGCVFSAKLS